MIVAASLASLTFGEAAFAQPGRQKSTAIAKAPATTSDAPLTIGLFGGAALPSGEYEDDFAAVGYDIGVRISIHPTGRPFGLHIDGEYLKNGTNTGVCTDADCSGRILAGFLNLDVGLPIPLPLLRPYVTGGVGYAAVKLQATETSTPVSASDGGVAWSVGTGARVSFERSVGDWAAFVEARYIQMADVDVALGPYRNVTGKVSMKPVTVGVTFRPCWSCAELRP